MFAELILKFVGRAGENRTLVDRLKAGYSAIELQPHILPYQNTIRILVPNCIKAYLQTQIATSR